MSGPIDRRAAAIVLAALAVGITIWAIGRLRPGIDGELARRGGAVVPIVYDREAAVAVEMSRVARELGPAATLVDDEAGPLLATPPDLHPGPGFRPPRTLEDGRLGYRPTPDMAEQWRKRAFNELVGRLDARLESLPQGRGQAAMPSRGALQLELTPGVDPDWITAALRPGELTLWRGDSRLADAIDVVRAELSDGRVRVALRSGVDVGFGPLEARLDGMPIARGEAGRGALMELPVLADLEPTPLAQAAMLLRHGPLPLPVKAGPSRPIEIRP